MTTSTSHLTLSAAVDVENAVANAISFLDASITLPCDGPIRFVSPDAVSSLMTPPSSSPPPIKPARTQVDLTTCRIRFLTEPIFIDDIASDDSVTIRPLRKISPSRLRKPSRSILKPSDISANAIQSRDPLLSTPSPRTPADCAKMLESIFKQLAGPTRASRLDAYHTLYNCLKHYNEIAGNDSLLLKMPLFQDFLRRDMQAKSSATGLVDTKLVLQALKVASTFLHDSFFEEQFTKDFLDFLIQQSITVISDASMPKEVVKNQLNMAIAPRVWHGDPAPELITGMTVALSSIHERVSGNNIQGLRLTMYKELIRSHTDTMLPLVNYWLPHIISSLSSSFFATRKKAIDAGLMAGYKLGQEPQVSLAVQQIFDVPVTGASGGGTFFDIFQTSLMELLKDRVHGEQVPQMWTVVVLLLRCKQHNIDHWSHLTPWFRVIQTCFNASHVPLNLQAWTAWNKLIFAVSPSPSTRAAMISALRQPLISQLQRKSINEDTASVRSAAYTSYRCLLYYTLRPTSNTIDLLNAWKSNVDGVLEKLNAFEVEDIGSLAATLAALFSASTSRPWHPDMWKLPGRMHQVPFEGGDARLEPAWVHKNATAIIQSSTKLLSAALAVDAPSVWASVYNLWQVVMKCLSIASAKEITSSYESNTAIAAITNAMTAILLQALSDCERSPGSSDAILPRLTSLVRPVLDAFGAVHFGERHALLAEDGIFRAVLSPSRRNRGIKGFQAPVVGLLKAYVASESSSRQDFEPFLSAMLNPSTLAQQTRSAKLVLLKDCMVALIQDDQHDSDSLTLASLWRAIAGISIEVMSVEESAKTLETKKLAGELGQDYQIVLEILLLGLRMSAKGSVEATTDLLFACCTRARDETGSAGCLLALLQPLVRALAPIDCQPCSMHAAIGAIGAILDVLRTMKDYPTQKTLALARRSLSGPNYSKRTSESDEMFHAELYRLTATWLLHSSPEEGHLDPKQNAQLLDSLAQYIKSTSVAFPELLLAHIDSGLVSWLTTKKQLPLRQVEDDSILPWMKFGVLWSAVCNRIKTFERHDSKVLTDIESLLCAGFQSWDKSLATTTIDLWNSTFAARDLCIPRKLSSVLVRLGRVAEVELAPNLEEELRTTGEQIGDVDEWFPWRTREQLDLSQAEGGISTTGCRVPLISTPGTTKQKPSSPKVLNSSLDHVKLKASKRKSTPRKLRHDDSQTDFMIINSTPLRHNVLDSQMMTEHQREVRSRQRADTALFQEVQHGAVQRGTESDSLLHATLGPAEVDAASQAGILSDQETSSGPAESIVEISSTEGLPSVRAELPAQCLPLSHSLTDVVMDTSNNDAQHDKLPDQKPVRSGQTPEADPTYDRPLSLDGASVSRPTPSLPKISIYEFAAPSSIQDPQAMLEKSLEQESRSAPQLGALSHDRDPILSADIVESVEQSFVIPLTESSEEQKSEKHGKNANEPDNALNYTEERTMADHCTKKANLSTGETEFDGDPEHISDSGDLQRETAQQELPLALFENTVQDSGPIRSKAISPAQRLSPPEVVVEIPSSSFVARGYTTVPGNLEKAGTPKRRRSTSVASRPEPRPSTVQIPSTVPTESEVSKPMQRSMRKSSSPLSSRTASSHEDDSDGTIKVLPRSTNSPSILHSPWARGKLNYRANSISQDSNKPTSQKRKSLDSQDSQSSHMSGKRRRTGEEGVSSLPSSEPGTCMKRKASHLDDDAASQTSQSSQAKRRRSGERSFSELSQDGGSTSHRRRSARLSKDSQILSPSRQSSSQPPAGDKQTSELEPVIQKSASPTRMSGHDDSETKPLLISSHTQENTPKAGDDYQAATTERITAQTSHLDCLIASRIPDDEQSQVDVQIHSDSVGSHDHEDEHPEDPIVPAAGHRQTPENDPPKETSSNPAGPAPAQPTSRSPSASPLRALGRIFAAGGAPPEAPSSPSRTMADRARDMYDVLQRVLTGAKNLALGPGELQERRRLEDISIEIQREIVAAGRRGEGRL